MRYILFYTCVWVAAVIIAPVVAVTIGIISTFSAFIEFFRSVSVNLKKVKEEQKLTNSPKTQDIWEKHIERLEKQKQK